jgi:dTDP-4-dehydrorhamnose reductase
MERILIFGDTPFGKRLAFYLNQYARSKDMPVLVMHHTDRIESIKDIQWAVWQTYVGEHSEGRPDLIVNAYEESSLVKCETDPTEAWYANSRVAAMIALAAKAAEVPLIQISSDHVFRGNKGPYALSAEPNPLNVYGVTKWYGENTARRLYPEVTIVRHSALYGFDVDSPLSALPLVEENETSRPSIVLADTSAMVPTFIAEACFLLARNILLQPAALEEPLIHMSTKEGPLTWEEFLASAQLEVIEHDVSPFVRVGQQRGLQASDGWYLPARPMADQWANYQAEVRENSYMRFWVS